MWEYLEEDCKLNKRAKITIGTYNRKGDVAGSSKHNLNTNSEHSTVMSIVCLLSIVDFAWILVTKKNYDRIQCIHIQGIVGRYEYVLMKPKIYLTNEKIKVCRKQKPNFQEKKGNIED